VGFEPCDTYLDVLLLSLHILLGYKIQHTYCLLPCGLLNVTSSLGLAPSTLVMLRCLCLRAQTMQLPVSIQQSLDGYVAAWPPQPLSTHRTALCASFRTTTLTYCLPPYYGRGLLSDYSESNLTQACLDGPLLALAYRKLSFGTVTCLTLIWTLNRPSIYVYNDTTLSFYLSYKSPKGHPVDSCPKTRTTSFVPV
jgi:hypothetical protein